jgi:O-succinylbenzoate synthase
MIEQPLPAADLAGHAWLQRRLRTPLCLDESIASLADAEAALRLRAARVVNLKPGRVGGLTPALAILQRCRAAGVDCYVGTMFETGVGASINLALATVPGCTLPASNLCSGRYLALDIVSPPLAITAPGAIIPARQHGLGRQVEEGLVGRVTLARYEVPTVRG